MVATLLFFFFWVFKGKKIYFTKKKKKKRKEKEKINLLSMGYIYAVRLLHYYQSIIGCERLYLLKTVCI